VDTNNLEGHTNSISSVEVSQVGKAVGLLYTKAVKKESPHSELQIEGRGEKNKKNKKKQCDSGDPALYSIHGSDWSLFIFHDPLLFPLSIWLTSTKTYSKLL
jgi:hypothetical protein